MGKHPKIEINHERLNFIVNKLLRISLDDHNIPSILTKTRYGYTLLTNRYFILAISDKESIARIEKYSEEGNHPFPGLIAPQHYTIQTGFNLDKTKYAIFNSTKVVNRFSFNLGEDSTAILCNHQVSITSNVSRPFKYIIDLLYLVSFGSEITKENFYDYLDELVEFSFTFWGLKDV